MAERERETIITTDGGRGGGGTILAVVLLIALIDEWARQRWLQRLRARD